MTTDNGLYADEKSVDPEAIRRSVQDLPRNEGISPNYASALLWMVGQSADEITAWGTNPKKRDKELREFITTEPIFASALGIICSRNAAFSWKLEGTEEKVRKYHRILEQSNFGKGWVDLMMKVSLDLYSQDSGAFIEVVRTEDSEDAEIISLNSLDAQRCYHTGAPEAPVVYMDRRGKYHLMKWYQVVPLAEMPATVEGLYGMQYCALTRLLRASQIMKNVSIYDYERTGGRHTRALHLIRGITTSQVQDAIDQMAIRLNARGQMRYSQPLIIGSIDPKADIGHDTLELASMPDNFDREVAFKWYISQIAMAFLEDYQSFAPLPGGNLGSSAQSEVLNAKARGKGPALFQKMITHAFNFQIFPEDLEFTFDELDLGMEREQAEIRKIRAEERSIRINSFEITPGAARVLAGDSGDLPKELFEALGGDDVTPEVWVDDNSQASAQIGMPGTPRTRPLNDSGPTKPTPATPNLAQGARSYVAVDLTGLEESLERVADSMGDLAEGMNSLKEQAEDTSEEVNERVSALSEQVGQNVSDLSSYVRQVATDQGKLGGYMKEMARREDSQREAIIGVGKSLERQIGVAEQRAAAQVAELEEAKKDIIQSIPQPPPPKRMIVRKEVIRTDPSDPTSPIAEVIEHHEEVQE